MATIRCICGEEYTPFCISSRQLSDAATLNLDKKEHVLKDADLLVNNVSDTHTYDVICWKCNHLCRECIKKSQEDGCPFTYIKSFEYSSISKMIELSEKYCSDKCINCDVLPPK